MASPPPVAPSSFTVTPRPVVPSAPGPTPGAVAYVEIRSGDTLSGIAQLYGLTVEELLALNPQIADPNLIRVGDRIAIPGRPFAAPVVAIVDGLGEATPATVFHSQWGHDISDHQQGGPLFTLDRPTRISEIGAFVYGQAQLTITVYPTLRDGDQLLPDRSRDLGTFALPGPSVQDTATYQAIDPGLTLPAGSYYAIFAPLGGGAASLLAGAGVPFEYRAASITVWFNTTGGSGPQYVATRILGRPLPDSEPMPTEVPSDAVLEPVAWQRVPTDVAVVGGRTPGLRLVDSATTPNGLVAVGKDDRGGVVVTSSDGVQWTRLPDSSLLDGVSLVAVAVRGRQMLVVGPTRILLWGTTDGRTWTGPVSTPTGGIVPADVAVGPAAWVIAETTKLAPDAQGVRRSVGLLRWSADGRTWVDAQLPEVPAAGDYRLTSVAYLGSRFVALGRRAKGFGPEVLVWTSTDGRAWRRGADIPVAEDGEIADLALAPDGALLAIGAQSRTPMLGAAFTSVDGTAWTRAADTAFTGAVLRGVTCDARGCVAVGATTPVGGSKDWNPLGIAVTWTSPDGRAWTRAATTSVDPGTDASWGPGVGMERVARAGGSFVAFGWATARAPAAPYAAVPPYADCAATWISPARDLPAAVQPPAVPSLGGHWEELPPLSTPRYQPAVAAGNDGRIFVFGGATRAGGATQTSYLASVEIFDPATRTWAPGAPIPGSATVPRTAVTVPDGRIFLFQATSSRVLVFDPDLGTWSTGPSIPSGGGANSAVLDPGGRIVVSVYRPPNPNRFYSLDPMTGRWARQGPTSGASPQVWDDGRAYGLSGVRAWAVDTVAGTTRPLRAMPPGTTLTWGSKPGAVDGLLWVTATAHLDPPGNSTSTTPVLLAYDPRTNTWLEGPTPPRQSVSATSAVAGGGLLYFIGSTLTSTAGSAWVVVLDVTGS